MTKQGIPMDYSDIDPGVRGTVRKFNEWGFDTSDSGDGVSKTKDTPEQIAEAGYACVQDFAHVIIPVKEDAGTDKEDVVRKADELYRRLKEAGAPVGPVGPDATPCVQATYDPGNELGIIEVMHLTDAMWLKAAQ